MIYYYPPHSSLVPGSVVIAYLRDSGGEHQEDSVERQDAEVRRWCEQYGLVLSLVYTDESKTAHNAIHKRKDLWSMMSYLRSGADAKGVIIWNYERFARNIKHGRAFLAEIEALDKVVCSLTDNIPEGPERYFIQDLKLWSAEQTSVKISIDVTSGLRRMVETHRAVPGIPPKGFRRGAPMTIGTHRDGSPRIVHTWEPDPDLAPIIRKAFEMRASGATFKQIMAATKLFPVVNSWRTFFNNRIYIGILQYGDLVIEDYCPPMVPVEIWNQVQEVGKRYARITKDYNPRRVGSSFLLSGLLRCQCCGSLMNGRVIGRVHKSEYYYCLAKDRGRPCTSRMIPARLLEAAIVTELENAALDIERLLQFQARVLMNYKTMGDELEAARKRITRELMQQAKRIRNLTDAIGERGKSPALLASLDRAEIQEVTLRVELRQLEERAQPPTERTPAQLSALAAALKEALHGDDIHQKKHVIHMLTVRILALRTGQDVDAVLDYVPTVCVGSSAPTGEHTVGIHYTIPRYKKMATV